MAKWKWDGVVDGDCVPSEFIACEFHQLACVFRGKYIFKMSTKWEVTWTELNNPSESCLVLRLAFSKNTTGHPERSEPKASRWQARFSAAGVWQLAVQATIHLDGVWIDIANRRTTYLLHSSVHRPLCISLIVSIDRSIEKLTDGPWCGLAVVRLSRFSLQSQTYGGTGTAVDIQKRTKTTPNNNSI